MKKTTKKQPKKARGSFTFDPVQCIEQYEELQNIGSIICQELSGAISYDGIVFEYKGVGADFYRKKTVNIQHDCTWWTIPVNVLQQGVDASVAYITKEHAAKLEERKKEIERSNKELAKYERLRDIEEYRRLREKLGIKSKKGDCE